MPTCKFKNKTLSHIFLYVFCLHFLRTHHDYFFRRAFESVRVKFLSGNISKKQCYLLNYNSSKSTSFILNVAFVFVLVRFSLSKLKFIAIQRLQKHSSFPSLCVLICSTFDKKLIVLHQDDNTFPFYFDICLKLTLSAMILTMEK